MSKRRRSSGSRRVADAKWWGPTEVAQDRAGAPEDANHPSRPADGLLVRPTPDPGALVRSLGAPPLAVDANVAERHLTAVYEEAVRTATALAAANGLLATDAEDA